ncbi:MAG: hypothetical protein R3C39_11305 [Dehalococcoidia bacterium]
MIYKVEREDGDVFAVMRGTQDLKLVRPIPSLPAPQISTLRTGRTDLLIGDRAIVL